MPLFFSCAENTKENEEINEETNEDKNYNDDFLKFPTIIQVTDKFFDDYQFEENSSGSLLRNQFQKKPDGWHVVTQEYDGEEWYAIEDELFWDLEEEEFNKINYPESEGNSEKEKEEYIEGLSKNMHGVTGGYPEWYSYYNIFPYYGYDESREDVINLLKDAENLPDSTLYALARCYNNYSFNLLGNQHGVKVKDRFDLADTKNCLSKNQLKKYRYYAHKANKKFKEVYEINPNFETIVGSIHTKWSNEYISTFLNLRVYQNEEEAKKELRDNLYDPLAIDVAKNYLMSCEKDAILFTNGDNDTYPLHYVQEQLGFRKDVLIVNVSLLGSPRHTNSYKDKVNEAIPMPSNIDYPYNESIIAEIIRLQRKEEISEAIKQIQDNGTCPSYIEIPLPLNKGEDQSSIKIQIKSRYIYQNDIALLDILANFNWVRPLYFINAWQTLNSFNGMTDYVQHEGAVSRLVPFNTSEEFNNIDKSYDLLMNKYSYNNIKDLQEIDRFFTFFILAYGNLSANLLQKGDYEKAILLANRYFETFSVLTASSPFQWDRTSVAMLGVYVQTKQQNEYYRIDEMIDIYTSKQDELESLKKLRSNDVLQLKELKEILKKLNQYKTTISE